MSNCRFSASTFVLWLAGCVSFAPVIQSETVFEGACAPSVCDSGSCGAFNDGCGQVLDCGGCATRATCGGGGAPNVCGTPTVQTDAAVTLTDGVSAVLPGSMVVYTIVASNAGPSPFGAGTLSVQFDSQLANLSWTCVASANASVVESSGTGAIVTVLSLAVGSTVTCTALATLDLAAEASFTVSASLATGSAADSNASNNSATDVNDVASPTDVDVSLALSGASQMALASSNQLILTVSNAGPGDVTGGVITVALDSDFSSASWVCAVSGQASCGTAVGNGNVSTTYSLAKGATITLTIDATASLSATTAFSVNASASTNGRTDLTPANNNLSSQLPIALPQIDSVSVQVPAGALGMLPTGYGTATVRAIGTYLSGVTQATFVGFPTLNVSNVNVLSPTSVDVTFSVPHDADGQLYNLKVSSAGGESNQVLALTVTPVTVSFFGVDSNRGTPASPLRTVKQALTMAQGFETITIGAGTFELGENWPCCGDPQNPASDCVPNVPVGSQIKIRGAGRDQTILRPTPGAPACAGVNKRAALISSGGQPEVAELTIENFTSAGVVVIGGNMGNPNGTISLRGVTLNANPVGVWIAGQAHLSVDDDGGLAQTQIRNSSDAGIRFWPKDNLSCQSGGFGTPRLQLSGSGYIYGNGSGIGLEVKGASRVVIDGEWQFVRNDTGIHMAGTGPCSDLGLFARTGASPATVYFESNASRALLTESRTFLQSASFINVFQNGFGSLDTQSSDVFIERVGCEALLVGLDENLVSGAVTMQRAASDGVGGTLTSTGFVDGCAVGGGTSSGWNSTTMSGCVFPVGAPPVCTSTDNGSCWNLNVADLCSR